MAETWTLDGLALNDGTTFRLVNEIGAVPPKQRPDWISAADSEGAALLRDPEHENRTIELQLEPVPQATTDGTFDKLGLIIDKLQKASRTDGGIPLVWTAHGSSRTVTFDVLTGEITGLPRDIAAVESKLLRPTVVLTCKPYHRGAEVLTSTASSATPFVTLEVAGVTGDVPALGRLIVTDAATQARRHVEWGLESRFYNSGTSLLVDSDNMVTSGFAGAQATTTGAYDPNAAGNNSVSASVLSATSATVVAGTGNLTHQGVFRVKARVQVTTAATANVRLAWQANDNPLGREAWKTVQVQGRWEELDLGVITVPPALVGTSRWTGQIEAIATTSAAATVIVDYLVLVPAAEGYGKARAVPGNDATTVVGYDAFTSTTAGNPLNARVAPAGGTWTTSGVATDFAFADNFGDEQVVRATVSDASPRFALLGATNYTDTQTQVIVWVSGMPTGNVVYMGAIARAVDTSNYLRLLLILGNGGFSSQLRLEKVIAGTATALGYTNVPFMTGTLYALRLIAYATGRVIGIAYNSSASNSLVGYIDAIDSVVATAGTLASGKPGFLDQNFTSNSGLTRQYDYFSVATPAAEPFVIASTRTMQIRHDATLRLDSSNTYAGQPPSYRGSRFLVPPGTSRVLVKARRTDIDQAEDTPVTDNTTIQVGYTPRGIAVPR